MLDRLPFPHIIKDDVLPQSLFSRIQENWPADALFNLDYPGGDIWGFDFKAGHQLQDDTKARFWAEMETAINAIAEEVAQIFAPLIHARFGFADLQPYVRRYGLLQHGPDFGKHGTHTHYYLSPEFVATCLLYVDDAGNLERGTSLSADTMAQTINEIAASASRFGSADWDESQRIQPTRISSFRPNRMLAFYEAPHSWHGVENYTGDAPVGSRRIIRIGLGVSDMEFSRRYGMTCEEFRACYAGGSDKAEHINLFADDIRRMNGALDRFDPATAELSTNNG